MFFEMLEGSSVEEEAGKGLNGFGIEGLLEGFVGWGLVRGCRWTGYGCRGRGHGLGRVTLASWWHCGGSVLQ